AARTANWYVRRRSLVPRCTDALTKSRSRRPAGTSTARMAEPMAESKAAIAFASAAQAEHAAMCWSRVAASSGAKSPEPGTPGRRNRRKNRASRQSMTVSLFAHAIRQRGPQMGLGPCHPRHHRSDRQIHLLGDVLVTELFKVVQDDGRPKR